MVVVHSSRAFLSSSKNRMLFDIFFTCVCGGCLPLNQLYTRDTSKDWELISSYANGSSGRLVTKEPSAYAVLLEYILSEKWQDIVDFDNHLDDISG